MGQAPDTIKRLVDRFAEQYREVVHEDRFKVAGQTKAYAVQRCSRRR